MHPIWAIVLSVICLVVGVIIGSIAGGIIGCAATLNYFDRQEDTALINELDKRIEEGEKL